MRPCFSRRCGQGRPPHTEPFSRGPGGRVLAVILACAAITAIAIITATGGRADGADAAPGPAESLFRADNLVAWCIVPFDDEPRSPADRAAMMRRLGIRKYAYDYRAEHVPQFDEEMRAIKAAGIELVGWWFPGALNDEARLILDVLRRHDIRTCLWVSGGGGPTATPEEQRARVAAEAARIRPIAEAAAAIGCTVGLYNHGGWFGEPENQIEVIRGLGALGLTNVGLVYNQHHGHAHVGRWRELLEVMRPHLYALNLDGMFADGEKTGRKIAPLGQGELDRELLRTIVASGYRGPFGILNHTQHDAEDRLRDNLAGLAWLARGIDGGIDGRDAGPRPVPVTWKDPVPSRPATPNAAAAATTAPAPGAVTGAAKIAPAAAPDIAAVPHDPAVVAALAAEAHAEGDAAAGGRVFTRATLACLSCHKVAEHGGRIGPALSRIGAERTLEQLAESLLWPQHVVAPEYRTITVVNADGTVRRGYRHREDATVVVLRDPATDALEEIPRAAIDSLEETGSMMPHGLVTALPPRERRDLVRFLADLGRHERVSAADVAALVAASHATKPADFDCPREPLDPAAFPDWRLPVNRDRVYDFYAKEARHFRGICPTPPLLPGFPGLDGGQQGHWGNQNEATWKSDRWNRVRLGSIQCGVLRGFGRTVPRAVCVQLGAGLSAAYDPDTLSFPLVWRDGFVTFSDVRHGFMAGLTAVGTRIETGDTGDAAEPPAAGAAAARYEGFVRQGAAVGFLSTRDGVPWLDVPTVRDGAFVRVAAPLEGHPLAALVRGGGPQWPETIETAVTVSDRTPFTVDSLGLPVDNPWNVPVFCGGHDFLPDGSIVVCTMHGDVWRAALVPGDAARLRWRRIASGLHQPLGLVVVDGAIHVLGRDQITRLGDLDGDGEMDDYRCFSRAYRTSPGGHDYVCGLERDARGRFVTASSTEGLLRIAADGSTAEVLATGLRNPDGVGVLPDGTVTAASSEGDWVPASLVAAVRPAAEAAAPPHFGHGGPRDGRTPATPLVWLPRGMDNSAGGQAWIPEGALGPLGGQLVHLSFGAGTAFALLRDECGGVMQGAIVPLPVSFRSGAHRARFHPRDGALYVSGMAGWGSYTPDDGCLERVRFTGRDTQLPVGFHLHDNGVLVRFAQPIDVACAADPTRHFAQCWNYRYSGGYGSAEYAPGHDGLRGHDHLPITAALPGADGRSLFLEIPSIRPVSQLHLLVQSAPGVDHDLVITANKLDAPFAAARPRTTPLPPHPLDVDVARALRTKRNPFEKRLPGARAVEVTVGPNLSYSPRVVTARAGEPLAITLVNPDSVPHNLALCRPGSLARVGAAVNALVTDPEAAARQYIPESPDVIAFTDIVPPHARFTISFRAPQAPGRHPFLCTFPGHWMAMQGELLVEDGGGEPGGAAPAPTGTPSPGGAADTSGATPASRPSAPAAAPGPR